MSSISRGIVGTLDPNTGLPVIGGGSSAYDGLKGGWDKFTGAVDNLLTGDRDWNRNLQMLNLQNAFTAAQQEKANAFSASEVQKNRDWQEKMSNSAYSRAASDLKSIGINPYAMLSGFSGASSPSGSSAGSSYGRSGTGGYVNSSGALVSLINNAFTLANTVLRGKYDIDLQDMRSVNQLDVAHVYARSGYKK